MRALALLSALVAGLGISTVALGHDSAGKPKTATTSTTDTTEAAPTALGFCPAAKTTSSGGTPRRAGPAGCRPLPKISARARKRALVFLGTIQSGAGDPSGGLQISVDKLVGSARHRLKVLAGNLMLAQVSPKTIVVGLDGQALDASRISDATTVRVRGRLLDPRRWTIGADGSALPTLRISRVQLLTPGDGTIPGGGGEGSCEAAGTCPVTDPCGDACTVPTDTEITPTEDTSPALNTSRFIGEVRAVDTNAGTFTLYVVAAEGLPANQSEDDFDGRQIVFRAGSDTVWQIKPDRDGNGTGGLGDMRVDDLVKADVNGYGSVPVDQPLPAAFVDSRAPASP